MKPGTFIPLYTVLLAGVLFVCAAASVSATESTPTSSDTPTATENNVTDESTGSDESDNATERLRQQRRIINERALGYLFSIQQDGVCSTFRPKAVTSVFILACLANGILPEDPDHGPALTAAIEWVLKNSSESFLGGQEEPNADNVLAALALSQFVGTAPDAATNSTLHARARAVLEHSLQLQDSGSNADYFGGWRPNGITRTNNRMLTAWYLLFLYGQMLSGGDVSDDNIERALDFIAASQKDTATQKPEDVGGFSVAANGLPVRSVTAAGLASLVIFDRDREMALLARDWLEKHPPTWYGPHFYESNFFAVRGLWRLRNDDNGKAFATYFARLVRLIKERQEPDGSIPFPPGHGGPIVSLGTVYSTAMALLILNVDRGFLPIDQ